MTKKISKPKKSCPSCKILKEKLSRSLADYDNLLKRITTQKEQINKMATASLVDKLLGVLDDFDRAQDHLKDKGLRMAMSQFLSVLFSEGVEEIKALNQDFNPESMDCSDVKKGKKNLVLEVQQKGYTLNGQVIRPVKVVVGSG